MKNGLFLPHNLDLSALHMQAKLLNVWGSKQEFNILKFFELATQAGLEIGLLSFLGRNCCVKRLYNKMNLTVFIRSCENVLTQAWSPGLI